MIPHLSSILNPTEPSPWDHHSLDFDMDIEDPAFSIVQSADPADIKSGFFYHILLTALMKLPSLTSFWVLLGNSAPKPWKAPFFIGKKCKAGQGRAKRGERKIRWVVAVLRNVKYLPFLLSADKS